MSEHDTDTDARRARPAKPTPPTTSESVVTLRRMLLLLLACVVVGSLWAARSVFIPITAGALLMFMCKPLVGRLHRLGLWLHASAALVVGGLTVVVLMGLWVGAAPTLDWAENLPSRIQEGERRLADMRGPWDRIVEAREKIEKIADDSDVPAPEVKVRETGFPLLDLSMSILGGTVIAIVLCFFMLVYWDDFLLNLVQMAPNLTEKKSVIAGFRQIESEVSRFLIYRSAINVGLGLTAWAVFHAIGLPEAGLWAAVAAVFNFVPYIGALVAFALISLASLLAFNTIGMAAIAPAAFAVLTTVEGFIVSPLVFGSRLKLNPVVVLVGLVFWSWLWGIAGALMAVPLIVCMRIVCSHVPLFRPLGELMTASRGDAGLVPDPAGGAASASA